MKLIVCPLHEVEAALALWKPSHVVSMASPGSDLAVIPAELERLSLTFNDIPEPRPGLQAASPQDVEHLVAFAHDWPRDRPMLIQCWAGVSRSPAAAYVIACALSEPGNETRLADQIRTSAPFATPNPRVVSLADQALGRRGAMIQAIARIGRGAETSMGISFELALG